MWTSRFIFIQSTPCLPVMQHELLIGEWEEVDGVEERKQMALVEGNQREQQGGVVEGQRGQKAAAKKKSKPKGSKYFKYVIEIVDSGLWVLIGASDAHIDDGQQLVLTRRTRDAVYLAQQEGFLQAHTNVPTEKESEAMDKLRTEVNLTLKGHHPVPLPTAMELLMARLNLGGSCPESPGALVRLYNMVPGKKRMQPKEGYICFKRPAAKKKLNATHIRWTPTHASADIAAQPSGHAELN